MAWADLQSLFMEMEKLRDSERPMGAAWRSFRDAVRAETPTPYHLVGLLRELERIDKPREKIVVFEHGCGSAQALLYLLALGYRGVCGVDIGSRCAAWHPFLRDELGIAEQRFIDYDGHRLPLADASVDFVFSQQVIEHVAPDCIDDYYREEGRVLRAGGRAYHEVPHRLSPYDSHSGTWFVHLLPLRLARSVYGLLGRRNAVVDTALFLRMPGYHRRQVERHIGPCRDLTARRLTEHTDYDYYDGPVELRRMMGRLCRMPILGGAAVAVLRRLIMLETVAVKR